MESPSWIGVLLGADPVPWLLASDEPHAVLATLTGVLGAAPDDPGPAAAHAAVLEDRGVRGLIQDLPGWGEEDDFPGHHSPKFLPNRLNLLADLGVRGGDSTRVEELLDTMLARQDEDGRFLSYGRYHGRPKPEWGSLLCDTNAIADVMMRFGRGGDERVRRALEAMGRGLTATPQGEGWRCVPEKGFRGPGRKADVCPQVTLEGLRAFSRLPAGERPPAIAEAARTPLAVWRRRTEERPYQFGHGYQFKSVKWPLFWYDVLWVLDVVGRFPEVWSGPDASGEDRRAAAELAACLVAYNFDEDGAVTPRRTYKGFEHYSFGQKRAPSAFATARCLATLAPFAPIADEVAAVDVEALPSSKGSGAAVPPRHRVASLTSGAASDPEKAAARAAVLGIDEQEPEPESACPVPSSFMRFSWRDAVGRVLARHHLGTPQVPANIGSLVADVVGLHATNAETPYLSLAARLPAFRREQLDDALYERRSLVRFRCMRGTLFVVRTTFLPVVHAATTEQVVGYARRFAELRGVAPEVYERLAPAVIAALEEEGPLTTQEIGRRLRADGAAPRVDMAALVTLLGAEGAILRHRPPKGWLDRRPTWVPFAAALPEVRLDRTRRDDADIELVRAYVRAFGPATATDASWWTGIGPKRVRRALIALGDEVVPAEPDTGPEPDGEPYLLHAADVDELGVAHPSDEPAVALLPALDPLIMGYGHKARFMGEDVRPYLFDHSGNCTATVVVDGRVQGVWDVGAEPARVLVHLFPGAPGDAREAVLQRARELGAWWFGEEAAVEQVASMRPVADRSAGAFMKPLRP